MKIGLVPYNFVPLSEKVCYLTDEESNVHYDIPFEDGLTGTIKYTIAPKGPLFVKDDKDSPLFSNLNGDFFIPATSLKGCFRNVLEIMSFSKMSKDFVADTRLSYRDTTDKRYRDGIRGVVCGWMRKDKGRIYIDSFLEPPYKITSEVVDELLAPGGQTLLTTHMRSKLKTKERSAEYKNNDILKYDDTSAEKVFNFSYQVIRGEKPLKNGKTIKYSYKLAENTVGVGTFKGRIVLTGQPNDKKHHEFVFPEEYFGAESAKHSKVSVMVSDDVFRDFEDIHATSKDYTQWRKEQLDNGKAIPVFFKYIERSGKYVAESIGLSSMYKIYYDQSIHDGICEWKGSYDIAEILFGYVGKADALKGRVQFQPAFFKGTEEAMMKYIFGSPHPTFYPTYLKKGKTWNDHDVAISGWKRYPVQFSVKDSQINEDVSEETIVSIKPVKSQGEFEGAVKFFNLRPWELGALLSALTFHGHKECYHSIGMGKAYGYGAIKVDISGIKYAEWSGIENNRTVEEYMEIFRSFVSDRIGMDVEDSSQWKELLAMATGMPENKNAEQKSPYMTIEEHMEVKKEKNIELKYLPPYSALHSASTQFPKWVNWGKNNRFQFCIIEKGQLVLTNRDGERFIVDDYAMIGGVAPDGKFKAYLKYENGILKVDIIQ